MRLPCLAILLIAGPVVSSSQSKADSNAILDMCGCYAITFEFAETFASDTNYTFRDNYSAAATEWVQPVEVSKGHIVLQHLLTMGDYVVKHWRQDWDYQPTKKMEYVRDRTWNFVGLSKEDSKKRWIQSVYQVDDSPRYSGIGTWIHADGKHFWEAESRTPLPRREYTRRSDYDVMNRLNRHEITATGWVHEQDNQKVQLLKEGEHVLVEEKGRNVYTRIPDENCMPSIEYWASNAAFWNGIRDHWNSLFENYKTISLHNKVDGKHLYELLFEMPESGAQDIINSFIIQDTSLSASKIP